MVQVECGCGNLLEVGSDQAGQAVQCDCGRVLRIPPADVLGHFEAEGAHVPADVLAALEVDQGSDEPAEGLPDRFLVHFGGEVGSHGRICLTSLTNYTEAALRELESAVADLPSAGNVELLVSCALFPGGEKLIELETKPDLKDETWSGRLIELITAVPTPRVFDGPVSMGFYRRVGAAPDEVIHRFALQPMPDNGQRPDRAHSWADAACR